MFSPLPSVCKAEDSQFESHLGHVFSLFRGLWASEGAQSVQLWAPSGAYFLLAAVAVAGCILSCVVDGSGLCYYFMGACGVYYMTLWTWEAMCRRG